MANILVLDDNEDLRTAMDLCLSNAGHQTSLADSVAAARNLLGSNNQFELLILDWDLPDGQGITVCEEYRQRGGSAGVLMLTGRSSKEEKVAGLRAGADDYLTKPFEIEELFARIEAIIRRTRPSAPPAPTVFDEQLCGQTLASKYLIERLLGTGGMGVVYKARHDALNRNVAIKVLLKGCDPEALKRFEQEARAMSLLNHPNLVAIYDYGLVGAVPYIVMEFISGVALNTEIHSWSRLPLSRALPLFVHICDAVQHAHDNSLIHRDLKPSNIMLCQTEDDREYAKILDLGLVKATAPLEGMAMGLTRTDELFGSPYYMSPEQALSQDLDPRTDLYSMACLMFETLTGRVPWQGNSFMETVLARLMADPPHIREVCPEAKFSEKLDNLLVRTMARNREDRPASMRQLKQELESL